jgi:proline dehydrogenase
MKNLLDSLSSLKELSHFSVSILLRMSGSISMMSRISMDSASSKPSSLGVKTQTQVLEFMLALMTHIMHSLNSSIRSLKTIMGIRRKTSM